MKIKKVQNKPILLTDSAEKPHKRWMWQSNNEFDGSQIVNIQDGDYSISSFVDKQWLYLEKKGSCYELYTNLFSDDWKRFKACLERAKTYRYRYIIVEASVSDLYYQRPPKAKVPPEGVLRKLLEISMDYNICVMFCGTHAKTVALSVLKRAYDRWLVEQKEKK